MAPQERWTGVTDSQQQDWDEDEDGIFNEETQTPVNEHNGAYSTPLRVPSNMTTNSQGTSSTPQHMQEAAEYQASGHSSSKIPNNGKPQAYIPPFEEWVIQNGNFSRMHVEARNRSQMDAGSIQAAQGLHSPEDSFLDTSNMNSAANPHQPAFYSPGADSRNRHSFVQDLQDSDGSFSFGSTFGTPQIPEFPSSDNMKFGTRVPGTNYYKDSHQGLPPITYGYPGENRQIPEENDYYYMPPVKQKLGANYDLGAQNNSHNVDVDHMVPGIDNQIVLNNQYESHQAYGGMNAAPNDQKQGFEQESQQYLSGSIGFQLQQQKPRYHPQSVGNTVGTSNLQQEPSFQGGKNRLVGPTGVQQQRPSHIIPPFLAKRKRSVDSSSVDSTPPRNVSKRPRRNYDIADISNSTVPIRVEDTIYVTIKAPAWNPNSGVAEKDWPVHISKKLIQKKRFDTWPAHPFQAFLYSQAVPNNRKQIRPEYTKLAEIWEGYEDVRKAFFVKFYEYYADDEGKRNDSAWYSKAKEVEKRIQSQISGKNEDEALGVDDDGDEDGEDIDDEALNQQIDRVHQDTASMGSSHAPSNTHGKVSRSDGIFTVFPVLINNGRSALKQVDRAGRQSIGNLQDQQNQHQSAFHPIPDMRPYQQHGDPEFFPAPAHFGPSAPGSGNEDHSVGGMDNAQLFHPLIPFEDPVPHAWSGDEFLEIYDDLGLGITLSRTGNETGDSSAGGEFGPASVAASPKSELDDVRGPKSVGTKSGISSLAVSPEFPEGLAEQFVAW